MYNVTVKKKTVIDFGVAVVHAAEFGLRCIVI